MAKFKFRFKLQAEIQPLLEAMLELGALRSELGDRVPRHLQDRIDRIMDAGADIVPGESADFAYAPNAETLSILATLRALR